MQIIKIDAKIPNIGITVNNKLVELSHIFEKAELSLYAAEYDSKKISESFLGNAIMHDLIGYTLEAVNALREYDKKYKNISYEKIDEIKALQNMSPIKKFFAKLRGKYKEDKITFGFDEEEKNKFREVLSIYSKIDNEVYRYNLKDDIAETIGKYIYDKGYHGLVVPDILDKYVVHDLEKLGLEEEIPNVYKSVTDKYVEGIENGEIDEKFQKVKRNTDFVEKVEIDNSKIQNAINKPNKKSKAIEK